MGTADAASSAANNRWQFNTAAAAVMKIREGPIYAALDIISMIESFWTLPELRRRVTGADEGRRRWRRRWCRGLAAGWFARAPEPKEALFIGIWHVLVSEPLGE